MQMSVPEPEQVQTPEVAPKKETLKTNFAANSLSAEELEHDLSEQLKRSKKLKKESIHDL